MEEVLIITKNTAMELINLDNAVTHLKPFTYHQRWCEAAVCVMVDDFTKKKQQQGSSTD